ncbi:hypothetical protein [Ornithinimicrobium sp. W1665]|uniref:hypothetical protein n=1 Tax=Ornithinimicrobium sp. W1665 TaxID=3416666 RepID=UPI003CF01E23
MPLTAEQAGLDTSVLELYINDHLAGASGGRDRAHRMVEDHADLPITADLAEFARELDEEWERVDRLIKELGLDTLRYRQLAASLGEKLGRLKLNRRLTRRSPMTPLLETELMRGAVNAKRGLWQVMEELAPRLQMDPTEWHELDAQAAAQSERLDRVHAALRPDAFVPGSPPS